MEYTSEQELPELAKNLQNQKKKRNFHGLYDFAVIDLTYSSSRMASVRLTRYQVETIFKKGKIREAFEPFKVSDVIEVLNHIHCVDYILDHVMEPLTQKFIRKLHHLLMTGTVDEYKEQVRPGEYRTVTSRPRDRQLLHPDKIHSGMAELIAAYEKQPEIERNHILDFHVRFEEIFPFEDGNGRVGRLLMFKECLRHNVMPFIINDKRRSQYLRGIKEWHTDRYELVDVVMEAQDRFEAQVKLQKLRAAGQLYLPADYKEDYYGYEAIFSRSAGKGSHPAGKLRRRCRHSFGNALSTYYELNCNQDTDEVKQAFDELYQAMTGKTLKEKDEVIYATCRLCSLHQQTGFIDGIRLGLQLAQEINI